MPVNLVVLDVSIYKYGFVILWSISFGSDAFFFGIMNGDMMNSCTGQLLGVNMS